MPVEINVQSISVPASSDLSAKQYYAVILDTTTGASGLSLAAAGKNIDGILQDKPVSGQAGTMAYMGVTKAAISASQTITAGELLQVDTGGTLIPIASGTAVAKALEAITSTANVTLCTVMLLKSNNVYA